MEALVQMARMLNYSDDTVLVRDKQRQRQRSISVSSQIKEKTEQSCLLLKQRVWSTHPQPGNQTNLRGRVLSALADVSGLPPIQISKSPGSG